MNQKIEKLNTDRGIVERCECLNWCRDGRIDTNHHISCSHFPNEVKALQEKNERMEEVKDAALIYVKNSYRPKPLGDAMRFDCLVKALSNLTEAENDDYLS